MLYLLGSAERLDQRSPEMKRAKPPPKRAAQFRASDLVLCRGRQKLTEPDLRRFAGGAAVPGH